MKDIIIHKTAIIKHKFYFGNHIAINPFFYMTTKATFGNWIHINSHVSIIGGIRSEIIIGDNVAISTGCKLVCRSNDFWSKKTAVPFSKEAQDLYGNYIKIGNNVILGANVTVLPDVEIGDGISIGANSLVTKSITKPGVYAGTPVKYLGERYD